MPVAACGRKTGTTLSSQETDPVIHVHIIYLLVQVFECLHPATIIILTSRPSQEHFSPHVVKSDPCCMLRCLQSSSWSQSPLVPTFLEPPNTIAGEAAASKFDVLAL